MGILPVNKQITPETRLQRRQDLLFNEIDGEVVMLSLENNEYYGMDKVGSHIWDLLKEPVQFKNLLRDLMGEYEVSEQQCMEDTLAFLNKLHEKNLLMML